MRELLINLCPGIGYKQASMFLRNIGYGYDLAIVDTHLIDYLKLVEVLPISTKVNNKSIYIKVENLYFEYAFYKQYNINKLDLAIWNVMRLYKSKYLLK
jgi:N-glycosylase/DNA lyase